MLKNVQTYNYNTKKEINNKEMNEILKFTNINDNLHNGNSNSLNGRNGRNGRNNPQ